MVLVYLTSGKILAAIALRLLMYGLRLPLTSTHLHKLVSPTMLTKDTWCGMVMKLY